MQKAVSAPVPIQNLRRAETRLGPKLNLNWTRSDPKPVSCRNPSRADTCAGSKPIPIRNLPRFFKTLTHIDPFL